MCDLPRSLWEIIGEDLDLDYRLPDVEGVLRCIFTRWVVAERYWLRVNAAAWRERKRCCSLAKLCLKVLQGCWATQKLLDVAINDFSLCQIDFGYISDIQDALIDWSDIIQVHIDSHYVIESLLWEGYYLDEALDVLEECRLDNEVCQGQEDDSEPDQVRNFLQVSYLEGNIFLIDCTLQVLKNSCLIWWGAHRAEIHLFDVLLRWDLNLSLFNLCRLLADVLILLSNSSSSLLSSTSSSNITCHTSSLNFILFFNVIRCYRLALTFLERAIRPLNICRLLLPFLFF